MYSDAERAAFRVLLTRARANEIITEEEIETVLPFDLFTRAIRLAIEHENAVMDRYHDEAWDKWRVEPETVTFYKNQLTMSKKAYKAAPAKLAKMITKGSDSGRLWTEQLGILAYQKEVVWTLFRTLSPIDQLWAKPDSEEKGWPPELEAIAPMAVVLAGEELPTAYALRRVLSEALGVDP